jgi:hypothetical protein
VCGRLDFDEENGALEIQRLDDIADRETDGAGTTCHSLFSGVLGCDREMGGREAFGENAIIEPIELILDPLCVQQTIGFRDNVSGPGHGGASELRCRCEVCVYIHSENTQ